MGVSLPDEIDTSAGDVMSQVFCPDVLADLGRHVRHRSEHLSKRLDILTASGPNPSDDLAARRLRRNRARRAAWEAYLDAAAACSLLDADVVRRLRGTNDDHFRSAMAECMTCWLFAGKLRIPVKPKPPGRKGKTLDLGVEADGQELHVEVKAPYAEPPQPGIIHHGDDTDVLRRCLSSANRQFESGKVNVLVLVPQLRTSLHGERRQLVKAFIGQQVIVVPVALDPNAPPQESYSAFKPDGKLVRRPAGDENAQPQYTRVSAVASIEPVIHEHLPESRYSPEEVAERTARGDPDLLGDLAMQLGESFLRRDTQTWMEHEVLVVHNPFAQEPLAQQVFDGLPQLVRRGDHMAWTDGHPAD